jgi:serine/threonine-protein kinase
MAQAVADGLKAGLAVQHAQVVRGFEAGRLDKTAFATYEMIEGRSVGALMERSQAEGHPFAADHALLIVSKAAAALEAAQAKKTIHGFLVPEFIHVTHDGEVSVRAFGLPPRSLRDANNVGVREARFLAPEVDATTPLDIRADIFSLGAQLFEMLTGSPLPRNATTQQSIEAARVHSPGTDGMPIPKVIIGLLVQALAEDPAKRFKDAAAFKKAVDTLLFSGDYSPTTFNLAFFMHTLFRDEGDDDSVRIKAEKSADYRGYLVALAGPASDPRPSPAAQPTIVLPSTPVLQAPPKAVDAHRPDPHRSDTHHKVEAPKSEPARTDSGRSGRVTTPGTHPPAASAPAPLPTGGDEIFQTVLAEKKGFPIVPVAIVLLLAIGGAGYYFTRGAAAPPAPTPQPTMNPAEVAALARVKELETQLASLEAEKAAAAQKAADEATQKLEAQARAKGRTVDPAELQRAQDEARKKSQAEQESRLAAERQKIEDERKKAEETRAAEAAKAAAAAAAAAAEATPAPTMAPATTPAPFVPATPAPTPAAVAATQAPSAAAPATPSGPVVLDISEAGVTPPQLVSQPRMEYPAVARAQRITGTVIVQALIDEQGNVAEARVLRGAPANSGLNQAALDSVKKRKYKPASKDGKPGRAWVAIQIDFKL